MPTPPAPERDFFTLISARAAAARRFTDRCAREGIDPGDARVTAWGEYRAMADYDRRIATAATEWSKRAIAR
jgi:hypothetical protein